MDEKELEQILEDTADLMDNYMRDIDKDKHRCMKLSGVDHIAKQNMLYKFMHIRGVAAGHRGFK